MSISVDQVSAVIVTRGDVDLAPSLSHLPFEDIVIWDNSKRPFDAMVWGRHLAELECKHDVIYHQDDDLRFWEQDDLLAAYEPGRITANMPSPWYEGSGYLTEHSVMLGAGSLIDRGMAMEACRRYLERWPFDEDFIYYCDCIVGILCPSFRVDLGYARLATAWAENRMWTQLGSGARKAKMNERCFEIRGY